MSRGIEYEELQLKKIEFRLRQLRSRRRNLYIFLVLGLIGGMVFPNFGVWAIVPFCASVATSIAASASLVINNGTKDIMKAEFTKLEVEDRLEEAKNRYVQEILKGK